MRRLAHNLWNGLRTSPRHGWRRWLPLACAYAVVALAIALITGFVNPGLAESHLFLFLPFTLLIFPVLFEEVFFRGLLIPREIRGRRKTAGYVIVSSILFTLWHPLNALTINPTARDTFLRPDFLGIVFLLGLACGAGYIISRSLWVPILIHWFTVLIWVLGLGGRNLILE